MKLNVQPIEKQDLSASPGISVHSIFYTLQGEGPFAGDPAVFVRLAGCNLQCPGCDTDYTSGSRPRLTALEIGYQAGSLWSHERRPLVVLSGGEPFRQNIEPLVHDLLANGFAVQVETNGTLYVELGDLWCHEYLYVVCSPKAGRVNADLARHIDAYKYVLDADQVDPEDGLPTFALYHSASPRVARPHDPDVPVYVQPIDVKDPVENARHLAAAVKSCLRYGYTLSVQMHKLAGLE